MDKPAPTAFPAPRQGAASALEAPPAPPHAGTPAVTPPAPPTPPSPPVHTERRSHRVGWRSRDVVRTAALVVGVYVLLRLLWFANSLVFVVFLGVLFGVAVARAVDLLNARLRIPRAIASALVVLGTIGLLVGVGAWVAPTLRTQGAVLRQQLPQAVDRLEDWINSRPGLFSVLLGGSEVARPEGTGAQQPRATPQPQQPTSGGATRSPSAVGPAGPLGAAAAAAAQGAATSSDSAALSKGAAPSATLRARIGQQLSGATRYLFPFLSSTLAVFAGLVLVIFLAIYIGADPELYRRGLMHLFPHRMRTRGGEVLTEMSIVLRKWLVTQLIAMAVIGVVTTAVLLALRVKAAVALGVIAGLLEFVPTIGPFMSALPAIAMGFVDSPEKALYVAIAYVGIQFLENHLLIPLLMKEGMDLPPALTIVSQALMALVFGFLGLLVAVPLLAATLVAVKMLYVEDVVGDPIVVRDEGVDDD